MLLHFAQQRVNIFADTLGTDAGISYKGIAGTAGFAFFFGVEYLIGKVANLCPQAFEPIAQPPTQLGAFFGSHEHTQQEASGSPDQNTPPHCTYHTTQCVFFHLK